MPGHRVRDASVRGHVACEDGHIWYLSAAAGEAAQRTSNFSFAGLLKRVGTLCIYSESPHVVSFWARLISSWITSEAFSRSVRLATQDTHLCKTVSGAILPSSCSRCCVVKLPSVEDWRHPLVAPALSF